MKLSHQLFFTLGTSYRFFVSVFFFFIFIFLPLPLFIHERLCQTASKNDKDIECGIGKREWREIHVTCQNVRGVKKKKSKRVKKGWLFRRGSASQLVWPTPRHPSSCQLSKSQICPFLNSNKLWRFELQVASAYDEILLAIEKLGGTHPRKLEKHESIISQLV